MSILNFIRNLLKIKGYSVTAFTFRNRFKELWLEVKPYKNGAQCPHCGRRGKIIRTLDTPRTCVMCRFAAGWSSWSIDQGKSGAEPMVGSRKASHGPLHIPGSAIDLNMPCLVTV